MSLSGRGLRLVNRTRCMACGRVVAIEPVPYLNAGPHRHRSFRELKLLRCSQCDTAWTSRSPSARQLSTYYATAYTPARMHHVDNDHWPIWDSRPVSLIVLGRLFMAFQDGERFIDVGPGNGAALSVAPLLLPNPRIGCVEFNERSIDYFRRHDPTIDVRESMGQFIDHEGEGSVGMVYSSHSLEHFRPDDLLPELKMVYRALRVGGVMTIEVPYAPATKAVAVERHTPHLLFFSDEGLQRLLERAGFSVAMCTKVVGRTKFGLKYMRTHYSPSDGSLGPRLKTRASTLNVGDLVGTDAPPEDSAGVVLKCVAVKRTPARDHRAVLPKMLRGRRSSVLRRGRDPR